MSEPENDSTEVVTEDDDDLEEEPEEESSAQNAEAIINTDGEEVEIEYEEYSVEEETDDDDDDDEQQTSNEVEYEDEHELTPNNNNNENIINTNNKQQKISENNNELNEKQNESDTIEDEIDSSEEDDDEDESESEEAEPQLKYQRLGGDISKATQEDSATCLGSHTRFLVLGMKSGTIYVLDPHGDIIKKYKPHKDIVNDISIDINGDYVASCSKDGRVVIRDIFKDVQTTHNFRNQQLLSIQLHPNYGITNQFVTGGRGQQLLLRTIGFFRSDNRVLHSGEGPIYKISWNRELIAWANDRGVKLYDIDNNKPIAHINRSTKGSPDPERYKACLCWENNETLLIGWGDWVKIGSIRTITTQQGHTIKEVHVTNVFITDHYICGIAPFKENLILLAFTENGQNEDSSDDDENNKKKKNESEPPELRIVGRRGQWIATDALPIKGFELNQASDYKLIWAHDKNNKTTEIDDHETFYIISPKDLVAALPRTAEDHIRWLWKKGDYEFAWREAVRRESELNRSKLKPSDLGEEYLKYVLEKDKKKHNQFGELCTEVCGNNIQLWEKWINVLSEKVQLGLIIGKVKLEELKLGKQSYELVLDSLIKNNHTMFLECVKKWNPNIYDIDAILTKATNHLNRIRTSNGLVQALAELYRMNEEYDKSLEFYLQLIGQILNSIPEHFNISTVIQNNPNWKNYTIEIIIERELEYINKKNKINEQKNDDINIDIKLKESKLKQENMNELLSIQNRVFNMIHEYTLYEKHVEDKILPLIELDCAKSCELFVEHRDYIPPSIITKEVQKRIKQLDIPTRSSMRGNKSIKNVDTKQIRMNIHKNTEFIKKYKKYLKLFLYRYLHMLVGLGDGTDYPEFHDILVKLYSEFDAIQLRQFLQLSHHVTFPKALSICQQQISKIKDEKCQEHLNDCYQFILHRMGNYREALQVILVKLKNVAKAVQYVEKQQDKSLWDELIERTVASAGKLMPELLDAIKGHPKVDVRDLVEKIPDNLKIDGLRNKLIAIFEEYGREKSVTLGTTNILHSDCLLLKDRLVEQAREAILINDTENEDSIFCTICNVPLKSYTNIYKQNEARMKTTSDNVKEMDKIHHNINTNNLNLNNKSSNSKLDRLMKFAGMNTNDDDNNDGNNKIVKNRLYSISIQNKEEKKKRNW